MGIEIKTKKDYWGAWQAKSRLSVEGDRYLEVTTSKNSAGQVVTRASAVIVEKSSDPRIEIVKFAPFSDFSANLAVNPAKRVTEKTVREQQQAALVSIGAVINAAKAFYAGAAA